MKRKVSVSFLTSKKIKNDLLELEFTDCDYIHVDVMDGKFVDNKNNPYKHLKKLRNIMTKRLDVHLMVENPKKFIDKYAKLNTEYITIHSEISDLDQAIERIKSYGIKVGLAINPNTDVSVLKDYLNKVDLILVMSVFPGLGGQEFILESNKKVTALKKMVKDKKVILEIDGGVNKDNIDKIHTDIVVSGSYILKSDDFQKQIDSLR